MIKRFSSILTGSFLFLMSSFFWGPVLAESTERRVRVSQECELILLGSQPTGTPQGAVTQAKTAVNKALLSQPAPSFIDRVAEYGIQRSGVELLPFQLRFISPIQREAKLSLLQVPDVNSEGPVVVARKDHETGGLLHLEVPFKGKKTTTNLYFNKPVPKDGSQVSTEYLIGPENKFVVWHIHGGGTGSAVAMNASTKARSFVKYGIPLLAVDQPGHGVGTRAPILNFDDLINYNLNIINQLIHPDVKIIFTGHSWGGMASLYFYLNYLRNSETDPQWRHRVGLVLPESPPTDVSMGGSARDRIEIEEEINQRLLRDPELTERIAQSDKDFLFNMLRNEKTNLTAQWSLMATHLYYKLLIKGEMPETVGLPAARIYMGKYDGLTFVGREKYFSEVEKYFGPDGFKLLDKMKTFRGENVEQGHQLADAQGPDGQPFVVTDQIELARKEFGVDLAASEQKDESGLLSKLNDLHLIVVGNLAGRIFLNDHVEYVVQKTAFGRDVEIEKGALSRYLEKYDELHASLNKLIEKKMQLATSELGKKYQIRAGSKAYAMLELEVDSSKERKAKLSEFIERLRQIEEKHYEQFSIRSDIETQQKLEKLSAKENESYAVEVQRDVLKEQQKDPNYRVEVEDLVSLGNRLINVESARNQLRDLEARKSTYEPSEYIRIKKAIVADAEVDSDVVGDLEAELESLNAQPRMSSRLAGIRKKTIQRVIQEIKAIRKDYGRRASQALAAKVQEVADPEVGLVSLRDAQWELGIEHTPARRKFVEEFLLEYDKIEKQVRAEAKEELDQKIAEFEAENKPDSIENVNQAEARRVYLEQLSNDTFAPQIQNQAVIQENIESRAIAQNEMELLKSKLSNIEAAIKKLKEQKNNSLRALNSFYDETLIEHGSEKWPEGHLQLLPSELRLAINERENALANWAKIGTEHRQKEFSAMIKKVEEKGGHTDEDYFGSSGDVAGLAEEYVRTRAIFRDKKRNVKKVFLESIAKGNFDDSKIKGASGARKKLIGLISDSVILPDGTFELNPGSLEAELEKSESERATVMGLVEQRRRKIGALRLEYQKLMQNSSNYIATNEVHEVKIGSLLNTNFDELWSRLHSEKEGAYTVEALDQSINIWRKMWRDVARDEAVVNPDWYPIDTYYKRVTSEL